MPVALSTLYSISSVQCLGSKIYVEIVLPYSYMFVIALQLTVLTFATSFSFDHSSNFRKQLYVTSEQIHSIYVGWRFHTFCIWPDFR